MAVWDEDSNSLDWDLARIGFVTKYMKAENLASASKELVNLGYRVIALDAGSWSTEAKMHDDLAPLGYGWEPQDTGIVLVFDNYDVFEKGVPAHGISHPGHPVGGTCPGRSIAIGNFPEWRDTNRGV
jgi:hypothetical protein